MSQIQFRNDDSEFLIAEDEDSQSEEIKDMKMEISYQPEWFPQMFIKLIYICSIVNISFIILIYFNILNFDYSNSLLIACASNLETIVFIKVILCIITFFTFFQFSHFLQNKATFINNVQILLLIYALIWFTCQVYYLSIYLNNTGCIFYDVFDFFLGMLAPENIWLFILSEALKLCGFGLTYWILVDHKNKREKEIKGLI